MKDKTCCFTGHRPTKFSFKYNENSAACTELKSRLKIEIINMINQYGVRRFITGMALGVDTWAAEIVLELKETYDDITLTAAVPCPEQPNKWGQHSRKRYQNILSLCDEVTTLSERWTPYCMMKRNQFMVDNSDYIIAVWNGSFSGGTGKTVEYAYKQNKNPIIIKVD